MEVNMPTADENIREALLNRKGNPRHARSISASQMSVAGQRRLSRSEAALDQMMLVRSATEPPVRLRGNAATPGDSDPAGRETNSVSIPPQVAGVQPSKNSLHLTLSRILLDMPNMGPSFAVEETVFEESGPQTEESTLQTSSSSSSMEDDGWERASSRYSSVSSQSSWSSTYSTGIRSPQAPQPVRYSVVNPVEAGVFDDDPSDKQLKLRRRSTRRSTKGRKSTRTSASWANKPLPPVPSIDTLVVAPLRRGPPSGSINDDAISKASEQARPRKSGDREKKTMSQAADDLENELARMTDAHQTTDTISSETSDSIVALLSMYRWNIPEDKRTEKLEQKPEWKPERKTDQKSKQKAQQKTQQKTQQKVQQKPDQRTKQKSQQEAEQTAEPTTESKKEPKKEQKKEQKTKQTTASKAEPKTELWWSRTGIAKSRPRTLDKHVRLESDSTSTSASSKQSEIDSSSALSVKSSRKGRMRLSLHLPLGRKKAVEVQGEPPKSDSVIRANHTLETPTVDTGSYIDAQISEALNEKKGIDSEWSTLYPAKAIQRLGIPLMSSSHIPSLSASNNERLLRLQLPRLETKDISRKAGKPDPPPLLTEDNGKKYPETPDDVGAAGQITSFIDSPTDMDEDVNVDNQIVIGVNKMDILREENSAHEVDEPQGSADTRVTVHEAPSGPFRPATQLFELDAAGSTPVLKPDHSQEDVALAMPSTVPTRVILALMMNVNNFDELFNYALLNKSFYQVYKENELPLMKNVLFQMNPPAWELREMSPPWQEEWQEFQDMDAPVPEYTPSLYLRHHARDIFTLVKLKSLIIARCGSFLRPETNRGLAGLDEARAVAIDEAFWRIWTFCRIFGSRKNRETDISGQMDWLNGGVLASKQKSGATGVMAEPFFSMNNVLFDPPSGFGKGNGNGLSHSQLYDMTEIWNCLGVMLQKVSTECKVAREAGVFKDLNVPEGDLPKEEAMAEEWVHYILTLGPSAVASLASVCPSDSAEAMFAKAKQMGLMKWEPLEYDGSRTAFLREAVSRTYESRIANKISPALRSGSRRSFPSRKHANSVTTASSNESRNNSTDDIKLQVCREPGRRPDLSFADDLSPRAGHQYPPFSREPIGVTSTSAPQFQSAMTAQCGNDQVIDPVDKALRRMVDELGFTEHDAKWALKITDTGDMIDAHAAVRFLIMERKKQSVSDGSTGNLNLVDPLINAPKHSEGAGWRWA
jgi:outer membrane biosynthesis protein TonB